VIDLYCAVCIDFGDGVWPTSWSVHLRLTASFVGVE
jgi:hypothetical protein